MRDPIFLVPGLGGTKLRECNSTKIVWMNAPLYLDCPAKLIKILDVKYDSERKSFISKHAIKPDKEMGDLRPIANVSNPSTDTCSHFDYMIRYFDQICNYRPGENLFGVPYDWRIILDDKYWKTFEHSLKSFIEKQQQDCPNVKCVFIAMSMGGLVMTKFLMNRSSEWKKKYIKQLITIGTPFGGSPKACLSLCKGLDDLSGLDNYYIKELFKNSAGSYLCQPNERCFDKLKIIKNYRIDEKTKKDYTVGEIDNFLDLDFFNTKDVKIIYKDTHENAMNVMESGPGPEIDVHVICGSSKDTIISVDYTNCNIPIRLKESDFYLESKFDGDCGIIPPFGDGVVPYISASYWNDKKYSNGEPYIKTFKIFEGNEYEHSDLLKKTEIMHYIKSLIDISSLDDL